ncbi:OmpW/AlkL family protein [Algicola sagamiensis]|uniref:OmpW/AlkL family protein n=1 Tax=Algicola sagamiensis TaxID=163869 RepID=UPI000376EE65|nr:OmpW family outer membrane protein [Algicola sagamiensis]
MMRKLLLCSAAIAAITTFPASAEFYLNLGAIHVEPNESTSHLNVIENAAGLTPNSTELSVNGDTQVGFTFDYFFTENIALEVVAATPFTHDIKLKGSSADGLSVGETKQLPPTILGQYHFFSRADHFRPFIGAGLNYTKFFEEKTDPALNNTLISVGAAKAGDHVALELDDSIGIALQAGANYKIDDTWGIHAMLMWIDINSDAHVKVNGKTVQSIDVALDPIVFMLGARIHF